jgi:hypothetical protein
MVLGSRIGLNLSVCGPQKLHFRARLRAPHDFVAVNVSSVMPCPAAAHTWSLKLSSAWLSHAPPSGELTLRAALTGSGASSDCTTSDADPNELSYICATVDSSAWHPRNWAKTNRI